MNDTKVRKRSREWMRAHPENNRKNFHKWYEKNKEKHYQWRLAYARANPQRHRAQTYACMQLDRQICEVEGCTALGERHHDDYSKPFEVRWLCKKHHKELSRLNTKETVMV